MHMTATLTKWYEEYGRHEIFAGNKKVALPTADHSMVLRIDDVNRKRQTDLDEAGIAKTAREEKTRARDEKLRVKAENERMAALYRQHVLKEEPNQGFVPLGSITLAPAAPKAKETREEVGSFGD
jgi:hypothetical protein